MPKTTKATATGTTKQRRRKTDRKSANRRQAKRAPAATGSPANAKAGSVTVPIRQSKKAAILGLLERPDGAAIGDLTAATGWQVHSLLAAILECRQPGGFTAQKLVTQSALPLAWPEQRQALGFA
jgi:hypothetical protein